MSFLASLLSRDSSGNEWSFWYVVTYLTAKGSLRRRTWRPFDEARAFVHMLGLRNQIEWRQWAKAPAKPYDIFRHATALIGDSPPRLVLQRRF